MKKCNKCNVSYELNEFNFWKRKDSKDGFTAFCKYCGNKLYNKGTGEYINQNPYRGGAIYIIWLGEKNLYYIGSTSKFTDRFLCWNLVIKKGTKITTKINELYFRNVFLKTNFLSIKILEKFDNLTDKEIHELERKWLLKVILKNKNCYNIIN